MSAACITTDLPRELVTVRLSQHEMRIFGGEVACAVVVA